MSETEVLREVGKATTDAVTTGVRTYGPQAVGLVLIGVPLCGLAAFSHFVLGVPAVLSSAIGTGGTLGAGTWIALAQRRKERP